ncbi:MAG: DUF1385 domain-containing protein [Oscillospiraceae bacterium]|nr:DUF1385 domain-containing protein [Oscillospiraceae bacterium]
MSGKDKFRTAIGGQALIEGILMRGPGKTAMVARTPAGIVAEEKEYTPLKEKNKILGFPLIRGVANFSLSMYDGMKALTWSAEQAVEEEEKESAGSKLVMAAGVLLGLALAIGLFTVLPSFIGGLLSPRTGDGVLRNLTETGLRLSVLILYMLAVSRMKDIRRVFAYHGAEHKTIACYEAGEELTADNVKKYSRFHPRCGTSFLLMVVLISLLAFMWVSFNNLFVRVALRLAMLPIVVAAAYEVNRLIGRHDNALTFVLRAPGLWLQRITTREPDESMIEVGIDALSRVVPPQKGADEWGRG